VSESWNDHARETSGQRGAAKLLKKVKTQKFKVTSRIDPQKNLPA
jgi:membrane-bound lytic murein transglycosylase MltF